MTRTASQRLAPPDVDPREFRLFFALDLEGEGCVRRATLEALLARVGLAGRDARLAESRALLGRMGPGASLGYSEFCAVVRPSILLFERAIQGKLAVPDFQELCAELREITEEVRTLRGGEVASYIPQLARVDPELFGVALCTVDGQRFQAGDSDVDFCVQSCCKPITYSLALEEHGQEYVHRHVGREPSGHGFNELTLNSEGRPHNPMINAGAIMCGAMIKPELPLSDRFEHVMERWAELAGGSKPHFSNPVYLSERQNADRNFALGYYMREHGAFPPGVDLIEALEFYFQCCSILVNARQMAAIAATLANGGVCPLTGKRVLQGQTVRDCLSLMYSCGMYDFSGEFAFCIGLPAKSGVAGALMIVVPNLFGLCVWSPRLDALGNSVRGVEFCRRLVQRYSIHNYDNLARSSEKRDPRYSRGRARAARVNEILWAAGKGDLGAIERLVIQGVDLNVTDYDGRTALHIAVAEGRGKAVAFLIEHGADLGAQDARGATPLDEAESQGQGDVIALLEARDAPRAKALPPALRRARDGGQGSESPQVVELIWAASEGDLDAVISLVARGVDVAGADYDERTALHLAVAHGHEALARYLLCHGAPRGHRDRRGVAPLDEPARGAMTPEELAEREAQRERLRAIQPR